MITCGGIITTSKLCRVAAVKSLKYTVFFSGSFCQIYRVTDEALIAKTVVWPNFFEVLSNDYILYVL